MLKDQGLIRLADISIKNLNDNKLAINSGAKINLSKIIKRLLN